jgi:hypothetical protein
MVFPFITLASLLPASLSKHQAVPCRNVDLYGGHDAESWYWTTFKPSGRDEIIAMLAGVCGI